MSDFFSGSKKLGILGGGQLGKMLIQAASKWDITCCVLDPTADCPASYYAHEFLKGNFNNYDDVLKFGRRVDLITIEIENVNTEALRQLQKEGKVVYPSPDVIDTIKDKGRQKEFYKENHLPTSDFKIVKDKKALIDAVESGDILFPFVQKLCTEGYDGRGVSVIKSKDDLEKLLEGKSVIENLVSIRKEISVIVSRNHRGDMKAFPPIEMEFNAEANLVEMLIAPALIDGELNKSAEVLGRKVAESLALVGVIAVEMFVTADGNLLINESAPRPHNSGHHTIEANVTSQYEQHLRAILGLPFGSTDQTRKAIMINLLGSKGYNGPVDYVNLEEAMEMEGVHIHIYGKKETKPFRKMGHITICGEDLNEMTKTAERLKKTLKVQSK